MFFVNLEGLDFKLTLDCLAYFVDLSVNLKYKGEILCKKYIYIIEDPLPRLITYISIYP